MIANNSTEQVTQSITDDQLLTELNKQTGFNFKKSVGVQIELAKYPPLELELAKSFPLESDVYPYEFIEENIHPISKAKQTYGIIDSQKHSGKTQRWQGYVIEMSEDKFIAQLEDLTNSGTNEIVEFDKQEVSPEDQSLLNIGATFYFSIGYTMNSGQREKISVLRFKRIAEWTEEEFDRASDRADELYKKLKWD